MHKNFARSFLALILIATFLVTPVGVFAEENITLDASLSPEAFEGKFPEVSDKDLVRGTTPRPEFAFFGGRITPDMIETAEGVYEAFLDAPVELFDWTVRGIADSTRMNSMSELEYVSALALEITDGCTTVDEKIYTVAEYLAKNIGYDHDYYTQGTHDYPPIDPYTVLQNGYTVCSGYARTLEAMLQSIGIPCVYVYSPDHEWSMAYNGERWMLIDVTWMSNCRYEFGKLNKSDVINDEWYDFTIEDALSNYNHIIEETSLGVVDGVLVSYPVYSELDYIYWPDGIIGIDGYVFFDRDHFSGTLTIPDTVETIGYAAFYDCDSLTGELKLPSALISVDEMAFYECSGFTGRLIFGESVKTIGTWAFASCTFSGDLILPDSLERIENNGFYYSMFSGNLTLGEGIQHIGEDAFAGCSLIKGDLIIPDSVTEIGGLAFAYCGFDGVIEIGENVKTIGKYAFYACESLKGDLVIPDNVTKISEGAFSFIGVEGDIVIGSGITDIPLDAFYAVQYAYGDIIIPSSVKSIGNRAFYYCSRIRNAYFFGDAPTAVHADDASASFGPYQITLNYQESSSGWTVSENYDEYSGTWMGYPIAVWEYVEDAPLAVVYGKITTYNPSVATTVELVSDGETVYSFTLEVMEGNGQLTQDFSISDVEEGVYDLVVTKEGHLSYTVSGIIVEDVDVLIDGPLVLVSGDVNGDGRVDLKDVTALTSTNTYGLSYDEAEMKSADMNGDKCFDLKDLTIITSGTNYGKAPIVVEY